MTGFGSQSTSDMSDKVAQQYIERYPKLTKSDIHKVFNERLKQDFSLILFKEFITNLT